MLEVRFEFFTAVTLKNAVFWDVTPCGSCKDQLLSDNILPRKLNLSTLRTNVVLPPKRRLLQEPHGTTSQKTVFFMLEVLSNIMM
jgi:hypothetical protein